MVFAGQVAAVAFVKMPLLLGTEGPRYPNLAQQLARFVLAPEI